LLLYAAQEPAMRLAPIENGPAIHRTTDSERPGDEVSTIRRVLTMRPTSRGKIIGQDPQIRQVLGAIDRVASSTCTVLVTGESGTGKELVVAALHDASSRRQGPLITINCGAIPLELVESELFGHARGAFTGAQSSRRGHVAEAEGGTLFLDEVGELPPSVQVKLLRLLQQREYTPLGESRAIRCDVRIVAATNRDLEAEVRAGRFREDLYYRLNVIHLHLPPLRERPRDVRLLATHFFRRAAESAGRCDLVGLSEAALDAVEAHPWPGNVRELENAIERGVLLAKGPFIEMADVLGRAAGCGRGSVEAAPLPAADPRREPEIQNSAFRMPLAVDVNVPRPHERRGSNPAFPRVLPDDGVNMFSAVESYQNNLIRQALLRTGGNKNRAAQLLGLNRTTLVEMIRRRGLGC
jgi:DNA-binding NtrC family response regulator